MAWQVKMGTVGDLCKTFDRVILNEVKNLQIMIYAYDMEILHFV